MRIALVSDAWAPQVNGVVRTLEATVAELRTRGHRVETITPDQFRTVPCPGYSEVRLAMAPWREIGRRLGSLAPHAVHIATEGPLGWAARRWCLRRDQLFTTSFHTRFPDYLALRTGLSADRFWPVVRRFHAPAAAVLVATQRLADELAAHGLTLTRPWERGVDLSAFSPDGPTLPLAKDLPRPLLLSVGRLAVEKNLDVFLSLHRQGTKLVVGDGPARTGLEARHPQAVFTGTLTGAALASAYRVADVLVFTSLTDTFGLVAVEALACGTPVAALPAPGPADILAAAECRVGAVDVNLDRAITAALTCRSTDCVSEARRHKLVSLYRSVPGRAGTNGRHTPSLLCKTPVTRVTHVCAITRPPC